MHEMEHVGTSGYLLNGFSALAIGWGIDRYIARGHGSANFAYKLVMVVAHAGAVPCMLAMAFGSRDRSRRRHVRLSVADGRLLARHVCDVADSRRDRARPAAGWGSRTRSATISGAISTWLTGFIVDRTGHFTLAFIACAVVSLAGIVGWIGMVPKARADPVGTMLRRARPHAGVSPLTARAQGCAQKSVSALAMLLNSLVAETLRRGATTFLAAPSVPSMRP